MKKKQIRLLRKKKGWTQNLASRIRRDEASLSTVVAVLECSSERAHRSGGGVGKEARQLIPTLHQCKIEKPPVVSVKTRGGAGRGRTGGGRRFGWKPTPSASVSTC